MIDSSLFILSPSHIPSWNFASMCGPLFLVFFDVMYIILSPRSATGACPRASLYAVLPVWPFTHLVIRPADHRVLNSAVALRPAHGAFHLHRLTRSRCNHLSLYVKNRHPFGLLSGLLLILRIPTLQCLVQFLSHSMVRHCPFPCSSLDVSVLRLSSCQHTMIGPASVVVPPTVPASASRSCRVTLFSEVHVVNAVRCHCSVVHPFSLIVSPFVCAPTSSSSHSVVAPASKRNVGQAAVLHITSAR